MKLMMGRKELEEKITRGICRKWFATEILLKHHLITHVNISVGEEVMKGKIVCEMCCKISPSHSSKAPCCDP
jgi:hypothetical protein